MAMPEKGAAEVLEVVPGGVCGDEGGPEVFAGMVVDGEQQGLLGLGLPPGVDGRVVLPEFADDGALPASLGLGEGEGLGDELGEEGTRMGGHGFAVPQEGKAPGEFIGHELKIRWALERQKSLEEASNFRRPCLELIATGEMRGERLGLVKPSQAKAEEMGATDAEEPGGQGGVEVSLVECLNGLDDEVRGEAFGELLLLFSSPSSPPPTAGARPSPVSFCSHPDSKDIRRQWYTLERRPPARRVAVWETDAPVRSTALRHLARSQSGPLPTRPPGSCRLKRAAARWSSAARVAGPFSWRLRGLYQPRPPATSCAPRPFRQRFSSPAAAAAIPVIGPLKREGRVFTQVVQSRSQAGPGGVVRDLVERPAVSHTDGWKASDGLVRGGFRHHRVQHSANEFAGDRKSVV